VNPLLTPPPDHIVTTRPRTHWIDTDVMLEVYSHGDIYVEWALSRCSKPPGLIGNPERRRVRMQGALWMAMALCAVGAVSISYEHENLRNILRLAPPDSEVGGWTSSILYQLGDGGVFGGWDRIATRSGAPLSDRDRDRLSVRACSAKPLTVPIPGITSERERLLAEALEDIRAHTAGPLVLVTRDGRLTREARAAGVDAGDPETIAARTMAREAAGAMFESRLAEAVNRYIARGPLDEWLVRVQATDNIARVYRAVWTAPEQPWFLPIMS
jgi:hypothetical protein